MPAAVAAATKLLYNAVDAVVPPKTTKTLLVASWNVRAFGGLTASWDAPRMLLPHDVDVGDGFAAVDKHHRRVSQHLTAVMDRNK